MYNGNRIMEEGLRAKWKLLKCGEEIGYGERKRGARGAGKVGTKKSTKSYTSHFIKSRVISCGGNSNKSCIKYNLYC